MVACRICCEKYPPYGSAHLCVECWKLYGGKTTKDRAPWVNRLINLHERESHYQRTKAPLLVSLDRLVDSGAVMVEELSVTIVSAPQRRRRTSPPTRRLESR